MQKQETTALAEFLVAHCLAYDFLGKVFFEAPTTELINTLKEDALFEDWPLGSDVEAMQPGLTLLAEQCAAWDEAEFNTLKRDYAQLFVGPNKLPAPPWESVYRSEERLLFEEETLQVRAMYRQFGMAIPGDQLQPDDHFGLEMMFVAHLCRLGLNAIELDKSQDLDVVLGALEAFFTDHICQWSDDFLEDVQTSAATWYFQGLAMLAKGCIAYTVEQVNAADEVADAS